MSVISWQRPPKPYQLLKTFRGSVTTVKSSHSPAIWTEGKIAMFSLFYEYHRNCKKIKTSLYDFGGRSKEFRGVCMDFEPLPKVHSLILVQSKSIKLFHMIHLKVIFHVVLSNYRFVKIWNPSQFLAQPRNGLLVNTVNGRWLNVVSFFTLTFYLKLLLSARRRREEKVWFGKVEGNPVGFIGQSCQVNCYLATVAS